MIVFVMFVILVALICLNVPIAVGLAVAAIFGLIVTEGVDSVVTLALDMYDGSTKFSLIAIPMFVLAGAIMNAGGITDKLINFVNAIIGFVRGGLAMVNIGVSLFFAEISGSAVADVAALGSVLIPQMKKRGYSGPLAAAVTSSSASLAIIIPPSIPMILYATSAGTSVEQLFVAGIIPGLLGAFGLMGMAYYFARRYNLPREEAFNARRLWRTLIEALPAFTLPVIILGGIFGGFVTATEAAGLAVLAALVVSAWYSNMDFGHLKRAMIDGGVQTAVVMLLVAASVVMGAAITGLQLCIDKFFTVPAALSLAVIVGGGGAVYVVTAYIVGAVAAIGVSKTLLWHRLKSERFVRQMKRNALVLIGAFLVLLVAGIAESFWAPRILEIIRSL